MVHQPLFSREFVLLCFASLFFFSSYHLLTPVFPVFLESVHLSEWAVGALVAEFMVVSLLVRPWIGKLSDEMSRKVLMLAGCAVFALCPLLYLVSSQTEVLTAVRLLHGASFALFYTASSTYLVGIIPPERKAEGISHYSNAIKVAMAFSPSLAVWLIQSGLQRNAFWISTLIGVATLICIALLKPPIQPAKSANKKGKLLNGAAFLPGIVMAANSLAFGALIPFVPMLAMEKHWSHAQWFYTLYAVFLIASRFLTGKWSDQYGRAVVVLPGMALVMLSMLLLGGTSAEWVFFLLAALYGLAAGTVQPSLMAMAAERGGKQEQGSAMATFTMMNDLGIAAGSFVMGSMGPKLGYGTALIWLAGGCGLGWLILLVHQLLQMKKSSNLVQDMAK